MNNLSSSSNGTHISGLNNNEFTSQKYSFKIVLLGEGAVGKTSLLLRYVENKFNTQHLSTLQAAFATKEINIDGQNIELNIWDTAGQEKFHSLGPIYYRDSQGALLVYDITDLKSFERGTLPTHQPIFLWDMEEYIGSDVKNWVKELRKMLDDSVTLFIIGNKIDLADNRNIENSEALEYAKSVGAIYCECSAKEDLGVNSLFDDLTRIMLEKTKLNELAELNSKNMNLRRHGSRRSIRVVDDLAGQESSIRNSKNKKRCC